MKEIREKMKSVQMKLFISLCAVIIVIIIFLILINNVVLETFYMYSKTRSLKELYEKINNYYLINNNSLALNEEIKNEASKNNFDILIKTDTDVTVYSSNKEIISTYNEMTDLMRSNTYLTDIIYSDKNMRIQKVRDKQNKINYVVLSAQLDNGYALCIRMPISSIKESVRISNNLLIMIGFLATIITGILASFISKKFTEPIVELNSITKKMARLDFSQKYTLRGGKDEINELGENINSMSDKLETTIKQLRANNIELERDIEEKSKIDEMRKQFISDVSHELKTPIALIQGYAEGLIENVNTDEESKKFYAEVILDESNRMDKLVKQLLELMKLEYGAREFDNKEFNITELINEVIRKCNVMIRENNIEVQVNAKDIVNVYADDFYIDQVITNYVTNAIKHVKEKNGKKLIEITVKDENDKIKISVFNTGENIEDENLDRIWQRFYKVDNSRNREDGGTGIGLALVKAIMTNYRNRYGVMNKIDGVEFYIYLDKRKKE